MRYLKYLNGRKTLINLYKSINRLLLEYGCVIFDNCTVSDKNSIEKVQYDAAYWSPL